MKVVLTKGTDSSPQDQIPNPVDSKYGPRTELAFQVALKLLKDTNTDGITKEKDPKSLNKEITAEDYKAIMRTHPETWKFSDKQVGVEARSVAANINKKETHVESISYNRDLLNSTKSRHKLLEKLVYERLVKECK